MRKLIGSLKENGGKFTLNGLLFSYRVSQLICTLLYIIIRSCILAIEFDSFLLILRQRH